MDRRFYLRGRARGYAVGYANGILMDDENISKEQILDFFKKNYAVENCDQTCPFSAECNRVTELTSDHQYLCSLIGIETE